MRFNFIGTNVVPMIIGTGTLLIVHILSINVKSNLIAMFALFRRGLAPHLKSLMGPWWFSQFDPAPEVSQAARLSFEVFPIYLIPMHMLLRAF